jgi:hypothetical protein
MVTTRWALAYLFAAADAELIGNALTAGNVPVQQVCEGDLGSTSQHHRGTTD